MKKRTSGFTLIELVIAMAVVAIGLAITIPTMRDFTNTNHQAEQINKLTRDFAFAKSEAVARGESVLVARTGATAGDWYDGWDIRVISDNSLLRTTPALTIPTLTLLETGGASSVTFNASGSASPAITIQLCDPNTNIDDIDKEITITVTGRIALDPKFDCTP